jgi:membrane protease subunit (stomatin/prohibitin family)
VAQVVGARGLLTTQDVTNYLRGMVVSRFTDLLGEHTKSILDLPSMFEEISAATRVRVRDEFAAMGLALKQLYIVSVSPTEETSKAIDEAASMGAIGDMDSYMKFKAARAIGDAALNEGAAAGAAQTGLGLGAGTGAGAGAHARAWPVARHLRRALHRRPRPAEGTRWQRSRRSRRCWTAA